MNDLESMGTIELEGLKGQIEAELAKRSKIVTSEKALEDLQKNLFEIRGGHGQPWVQPTGAHDLPIFGGIYSHKDRYWIVTGIATHEPGTMNDAWQEVWFIDGQWLTENPNASSYPEWDPEATYKVGDRCTLDSVVWECILAHGKERLGGYKPSVNTEHIVWKRV